MIRRTRPVWMEVKMENLEHNCKEIKRIVDSKIKIMAVVKADGEGHGAVQIGKTLIDNGIDMFAVAISSEAIQLRKEYEDIPILILGYTPPYCIESVVDNNLTQTIYSFEQAKIISDMAKKLRKRAKIHIKINTGMNRIGMDPGERTLDDIVEMSKLPNIYLEGIFTHLSVADSDKEITYKQAALFDFVWKGLEKRGLNIPIKHVSNSASLMRYPDLNYDMVRPGRILYGYSDPEETLGKDIEFKKVMSMKAEICDIRQISTGEGVSYGLEYKVNKDTLIATLPFGYGDGFTGLGKVYLLVNGEKVPVEIRITMDMTMIDVTGLEVNIGDEVIVFGDDGEQAIALEDNSPIIGISSIGLLFWSGIRVPRVYIFKGKTILIEDKLLKT